MDATGPDLRKQLTPPEVADMLRITKNTVYELIKRGELRAYKVGKKIRVDSAEVFAYRDRSGARSTPNHQVPGGGRRGAERPAVAESPRAELHSGPGRGFVLCGQDILLDVLARRLEDRLPGGPVYRSYLGSYNGLFELYQGRVHAATAHLWDGDTDSYNIPYLRHVLPGVPVCVVHLVQRTVGFYVPKGNPKNLVSWSDIGRTGLTIVNRERGSGMRVLLDERLRLMKLRGSEIAGYENEASTHLAVASVVARNGADFALGNEKVARQVAGIDFIPLQKEQYDLVYPQEFAEKPEFAALTQIVSSKEFKDELSGLGDYDLSRTGQVFTNGFV